MANTTNFSDRMDVIKTASGENEVGVEDIVSKIEQTSTTAEELQNVGGANQENASAISAIVDRFLE